nr:MAG TPA: hypothetical protein [Caudoviricetes sp.]
MKFALWKQGAFFIPFFRMRRCYKQCAKNIYITGGDPYYLGAVR